MKIDLWARPGFRRFLPLAVLGAGAVGLLVHSGARSAPTLQTVRDRAPDQVIVPATQLPPAATQQVIGINPPASTPSATPARATPPASGSTAPRPVNRAARPAPPAQRPAAPIAAPPDAVQPDATATPELIGGLGGLINGLP